MSQPANEPGKKRPRPSRAGAVLLAAGALLIAVAVLVYVHPWGHRGNGEDTAWNLTLVGRQGEQVLLGRDDIESMPPYQGSGGFFTTVGVVNGPYEVKGVTIERLCELVGGIGPSDVVFVSSTDGYSSVFDHDQITGQLPPMIRKR